MTTWSWREELKLELEAAQLNLNKSIEYWNSRASTKELNHLKQQVEEMEMSKYEYTASNPHVSGNKLDENKNEESSRLISQITKELKCNREHCQELDTLQQSIESHIKNVQDDIQKYEQEQHHRIDHTKVKEVLKSFQTEMETLQKELADFQQFNSETKQDIQNEGQLQEAMKQLIEHKMCMNCLSGDLN